MAERKILHSWREIASYAGRGVRTVQRYEVQLNLPVHRPAGKDRSAVLAFSDEIDAWLSEASKRADAASVSPHKETQQQVETKRRYLALAANAKRNYEFANAAYESCLRQAKRVNSMLERMKGRES